MKLKQKGFTLIELLVVISIIGLIASVALVALNSARMKARDARRKSDLRQIANALELYLDKNGSYPNTGASSAVGNANYSTQASWLSTLVTDGQLAAAIKDPTNIDAGPWCWNGAATKNTIYTYASDGQRYVLCAWMENTSDKETLQFNDAADPWSTTQKLYTNRGYSGYNYVIVK